ncbi:MAG: DNA-directed RNA polymerase subunit omega [Butyricicoccaceae bacterium]
MLKPSMQDLMKKVNNRYLLVNLAAQRARDISEDKDYEFPNPDEKAVQIALNEIADGTIEYREGPRPVVVKPVQTIVLGSAVVEDANLPEQTEEAE